ncbi:MAG: Na-K-Cl cotransporter [Aureispira sp.]|nr:Na-K-Cl cotransporter [Aureispira sp.]
MSTEVPPSFWSKWFNRSNEDKGQKKFGTFQGVFTPTVLTILGVIMYLRLPWIVGQAGVFGALAIVLLAVAITGCTALSMSSITTNIRIGAGGAFSIISQSLGLEMGGSIGVPLYFSQAFAIAMYVFGFREGWLSIFPAHADYALLIDFITFLLVIGIAAISTSFAFRIQYVMMAIIAGSIVSICLGLVYNGMDSGHASGTMEVFGPYPGEFNSKTGIFDKPGSFWIAFAVFFPAVTGVMAGANMSGDLANPRKNIPQGTLSAVVLTALIYIGMIFIAALLASPEAMQKNYNVFLDYSAWKPIVVAGLLGATFSSALGSFVGAPRILLALGQFNILPGSEHFKDVDKRGEPVKAMAFTAIVVAFSLLLRDLNAIAPLITMFFMITYAMINVVVLIEQSLGLPSFRPTLRVPIIIPLLGSLGCFFVMFIINSTVSFISLGIVIAFYIMLLRKELSHTKGDARSGLFTALAEWSTKKSNELSPKKEQRAWQPELLIPVTSANEVRGSFPLLEAIARPKGSIKILGMHADNSRKGMRNELENLVKSINEAEISASYSIVDGYNYGLAVSISMQALGTAFFRPNTILLRHNNTQENHYQAIIDNSIHNDWAVTIFVPTPDIIGLGMTNTLNIWLGEIPNQWESQLELGDNDLAVLIGLIIRKNWSKSGSGPSQVTIIKPIKTIQNKSFVNKNLKRIKEFARIPNDVKFEIIEQTENMWDEAPRADLNILSFEFLDNEFSNMEKIMETLRTPCLFTMDSSNENALI